MVSKTIEKALDAWEYCIMLNGRADFAVNDLLEDICKKYNKKYLSYHEDGDDDPIYHTICNLTSAQRREFIKGAYAIAEKEGGKR